MRPLGGVAFLPWDPAAVVPRRSSAGFPQAWSQSFPFLKGRCASPLAAESPQERRGRGRGSRPRARVTPPWGLAPRGACQGHAVCEREGNGSREGR